MEGTRTTNFSKSSGGVHGLSPAEIGKKIHVIRGVKVMLDRDLAEFYKVETRILNRNVRRHIKRFPPDLLFKFTYQHVANLISQIGISNRGHKVHADGFYGTRSCHASGILNSDRAIHVNIQIMRTFIKIRHMISVSEELKQEIAELRKQTDERFQVVFGVLGRLLSGDNDPKRKIGF